MKRNWPVIFLVLAFLIALFPPAIVKVGPSDNWDYGLRLVSIFNFTVSGQRDWQTEFALEVAFLAAFAVFMPRKRD